MKEETINNYEDLLVMLDALLREPTNFWDDFYSNREKGIPFFVNKPDENLVGYFKNVLMGPSGKALELGCGPGRNAIYFAEKGYEVDAVDLSEQSIQWAIERAKERNLTINFIHRIFLIFKLKKNHTMLSMTQAVFIISLLTEE